MAPNFIRQVRVTFTGRGGGLVVEPETLRVQFSCEKTNAGTPNKGTVKVFNLSNRSRLGAGKEFDHVQVEAGYRGKPLSVILTGDIREVKHDRQGVDVLTTVEAGDGDKAHRKGWVAKRWDKGTTWRQMVEDIRAEGMPGIALGEIKGLDDLPPLARPLTVAQPTKRLMDMIGRTHGLLWSYQNEALEIIPQDGSIEQTVVLSSDTTMVGTPTVTDTGCIVKAQLDGAIRPNRLIEVQSETLAEHDAGSLFRVNTVAYNGDSRDGDFTVEAEAETVQGGKAFLWAQAL